MKKLIKFLFLILFAHYVLGQNCKEATYDNIGGVEGCFNLETAKKNAICLPASARNPCIEIECKDLTQRTFICLWYNLLKRKRVR